MQIELDQVLPIMMHTTAYTLPAMLHMVVPQLDDSQHTSPVAWPAGVALP